MRGWLTRVGSVVLLIVYRLMRFMGVGVASSGAWSLIGWVCYCKAIAGVSICVCTCVLARMRVGPFAWRDVDRGVKMC